MIFRKKQFIGIDLGSRKIKAISLKKNGEEIILESLSLYDSKLDSTAPVNNTKDPEILGAMIESHAWQGASAATAMEDSDFQQLIVGLPPLTPEETHSAIQGKVESKGGMEIENFCFDYLPLSNRKNDSEENFLVYFTKVEAVKGYADILEVAKLQPVAINSNLNAILDSLRFNDYVTENENNVVVDIGESHISIGFISRGELIHTNCLRSGAGEINSNLQKTLQISYKEAEELKRAYALEKQEGAQIDSQQQLIEDGYSKMVVTIHDSITYLKAAYKDQMIHNIYLVGGGANKTGLAEILEESLNIPVLIPNALKNIQIFAHSNHDPETLAKSAPELHCAVGLALRGVA
jgi:type IV pilus assembly protein PilM